MAKPITFGKPDVRLKTSMEIVPDRPGPETPFHILILGDFSGRKNRGLVEPMGGRKPMMIDRDDFDSVFEELAPELHLFFVGEESPPITVRLQELEDFHPDRLGGRLDIFQALRRSLEELDEPGGVERVAAKLGDWTDTEVSAGPLENDAEAAAFPDAVVFDTDSLLDRILDESQPVAVRKEPATGSSSWDDFLHRIVQPHLIPNPDNRRAELKASVEAAITDILRKILHDSDFQALEANWRALHWVVSRLETDAHLKLFVMDITKQELAADLFAAEDLQSTATYRVLVEQTVETPGADPWSVVAGSFFFGPDRNDLEILGRMVRITHRAGTPFLSAADPRLPGCEGLNESADPSAGPRGIDPEAETAWNALRQLPESSAAGLLLPRFLLRLPYGEKTEPTERFDFEEMEGEPIHDHYLWGNPAFAAAFLFGRTFSNRGWDFSSGPLSDLDGLPLHIHKVGGESRVKPCAEFLIPDRTAHELLERGFIPLLSYKNRDLVRVGRFQSISDPPTRLFGRWESSP